MRLFVFVTHLQNSGHPVRMPNCSFLEELSLGRKNLNRAQGRAILIFPPVPLMVDMRDIIYSPYRSRFGEENSLKCSN